MSHGYLFTYVNAHASLMWLLTVTRGKCQLYNTVILQTIVLSLLISLISARHFRICLVYELASKIADAIPYCAKAVSLCKSRLESLKKAKATLLADKGDSASTADGDSKKLSIEDELEVVTGILPDLEKKVTKLDSFILSTLFLSSAY